MPLPLIPLAMWAPAAITAAAAAARGLSTGRGQRIVQGGLNLADKGITRLQNISQPYLQYIADKFMQSGPISQALTLDTVSRPTDSLVYHTAKKIVQGAEWLTADEEKRKEMAKNFFNYFGVDIQTALEQAGQELLEKEEPSTPVEKKKGGYVKKQRKRKHYKASGFVKMKKSKKKKYIKT